MQEGQARLDRIFTREAEKILATRDRHHRHRFSILGQLRIADHQLRSVKPDDRRRLLDIHLDVQDSGEGFLGRNDPEVSHVAAREHAISQGERRRRPLLLVDTSDGTDDQLGNRGLRVDFLLRLTRPDEGDQHADFFHREGLFGREGIHTGLWPSM